MKKILVFLTVAFIGAVAFAQQIETEEDSSSKTVTVVKRVRSLDVQLEHGQDPVITFRKERLRLIGGEVVSGGHVTEVTRNYPDVKDETVLHGGQNVSLQTVMAVLKKFHDKWETEDAEAPEQEE